MVVAPTKPPSMTRSPWAKLTTSMIPKIRVSPEATSARIMPLTSPFTVWIRICSMGIATSHPQVLVDDRGIGAQGGRRRLVAHDALLHDVDTTADLERERHVLLDQQDGHALAIQQADDVPDLRDHARHQPLGRLVEQDDARLQHHGPG